MKPLQLTTLSLGYGLPVGMCMLTDITEETCFLVYSPLLPFSQDMVKFCFKETKTAAVKMEASKWKSINH